MHTTVFLNNSNLNQLGISFPSGISGIFGTGGGSISVDTNSNHKFDSIIGLISQGVSAWGRKESTQITPTGGVRAINPVSQVPAAQTQYQQPQYQQTVGGTQANSVGGAVGSGLDGIVNYALSNPLYIFLGIGGLFLLFRQPPGRR